MSASGTSFPDPNWPRQDPIRPDIPSGTQLPDLPPDPLLAPGSFIASSVTRCGTLTGAQNCRRDLDRNERKAETLDTRRSSLPAETLNGRKLPADVPGSGNGDSPGAKKGSSTRGADASPKTTSSERPSWLPPGWVVEDRVRSSGATAGTVDKYYFDPVSGRRFRSKIEVLYFLETGTLRKRKKTLDGNTMSADGSEENKNKKSSSSAKPSALNFDFYNVPEKVEWVLTDSSQESWTPFIDNQKVPESTKREWAGAFYLLGQSKV